MTVKYEHVMHNYTTALNKIFNLPEMRRLQKTQEILKNLSFPVVTPQIGKVIEEWQSRQSVFSIEIEKALAPLQGIDSAIANLMQKGAIQNCFKSLERVSYINKNIFENINFDDLLKNLEAVELTDENLAKNEKEQINEFIEAMSKIFPEINILLESIKNKNHLLSSLIAILIMLYIIPNGKFYFDIFFGKTAYTVNRENVRIRTTPTTKTKDNIIKKLHKNEYVEEIENKNGWVKVIYSLEDGEEIEGWVYRTMLTKVD